MRRYVPLAGEWWEHREHTAANTVYEREREPRWSGLYDAAGVKLFAVNEMEPIGFRMEAKMKGTKKKPGKKKGC